MELRSTEGALRVRLEGDRVVASLDGEPLPADRLRLNDQYLIVLDGAQRPMATIGRAGLASTFTKQTDPARAVDRFRFEFDQVKEEKTRRVIGVVTNPLDTQTAARLNVPVDRGFVITAVIPGQPAAKAGLRPNDVVLAVDGEAPATVDRLRRAIQSKAEGESLELTLVRSGEPLRVALTPTVQTGEFRGVERIDEEIIIPDGEALFVWQPGEKRMAPEVEREVRSWVRRRWEASDAPEAFAAQFRDLERSLKIDEKKRRELEQGLRAAAQSLREVNINVDFPEISFFGPEGRDVAVFPRGPRRPAGAVFETAARPDVNQRLRDVEARLQRLEELLSRLIDTAPESDTSTTKPAQDREPQPGA